MESETYKDVEIIFVSSDRTEHEMTAYMRESHGSWLAIEHDSQVSDNLCNHFGVTGIPALIVMTKSDDGLWTMITKDGRSAIQSNPDCNPEKVMNQILKNWIRNMNVSL